MSYADHLNPPVPQTKPLPGQVANSGGGFSFAVDKWKRLERFLILGSEGGTYYAGERELTVENVKAVEECLAEDGLRTVRAIVDVSAAGRAPKNDPALVALAIALKKGDAETRRYAGASVPSVARIGTHLFHLAAYVDKLGGWGRGTKRAFGEWYRGMAPGKLALQAVKYQQRDGWSHRDVLRKAHPAPTGSESRNGVLAWMVDGWPAVGAEPHPDAALRLIWAFERAKAARGKELERLIREYRLPHECVPNDAKNDPAVWEAILEADMGLGALVRNLGKLTAVGVLAPLSAHAKLACERLGDVEAIRKARLHPLAILVALRTYAQGHGEKGSLSWSPVPQVIDALDAAFYASFRAVEPTNLRTMLAVDCSDSMTWVKVAGMPITPREAAAALALVTANVEPQHFICGFALGYMPLAISPRQRLDDVTRYIARQQATATDCSAPMRFATANKLPVDTFVVLTDSETNSSAIHPTKALAEYRQKTGIPAKLATVAMVSNGFSIADPNDAGQLDVVGFGADTPAVLADFARG